MCLTRIIPFPYLVGSTLQAVSTQGQINTPRRIPSHHSFPCTATCRKMNSSPGIDQWPLHTLISSPNETSNTLLNPTTLLRLHTTLDTAFYFLDNPRLPPDSPTGSDDSTSSIPEIIITPDNSQNSVDYLSFSPTKHDPKDQCPKELPDDPVRTYKKNVCPIVASSSESDMERCGSGIVPRRQSQPLRSNSSSKLTPLRYAPSCKLYNTSSLVAGDRCPRFC